MCVPLTPIYPIPLSLDETVQVPDVVVPEGVTYSSTVFTYEYLFRFGASLGTDDTDDILLPADVARADCVYMVHLAMQR